MDNKPSKSGIGTIIVLSVLVAICVGGSLFPKKTNPLWVYSVSSEEKPITSCLEIDGPSWSAMVVAMNCQKSVIQNIILCSQQRAVSMFNSKESCEQSRTEMLNQFGPYLLKTDPYENR